MANLAVLLSVKSEVNDIPNAPDMVQRAPAARSIRDGSGSTSGGGGSATGGQGGDAPEEEAIVEFNDVSFHYPSAQPGSGIKHLWVC
jgi:hypothetical protein